jgi:DNA-binding MarR family transcriptional regulator
MRNAHIEQIRVSLVTLRRMFQRKELAALWAGDPALDYTELRLLDAVRIAQPATVGEVAQRLGIDPSRASRQVKAAIERGVLRRSVDARDGRKVVVEVTKAGAAVQQRGSNLTRDRIAMAVKGWSTAEQERFARLFERFAAGMTTDA